MCADNAQADSMHSVVEQGLLAGPHVPQTAEATSPGEQQEHDQYGALITRDDVIARYSGMHFCHSDGTIGRIVNARRRNGGDGWEAMIAWYNADGTAEPMSEGDEECTSDGTLRWHKEGQDLCVRNQFVPDP